MRVIGYRPANVWLHRRLDERWRQWLTRSLAGAVVLALMLAALVGPRQESIRLRYEIAQVTQAISELERRQRQLTLEREALSSPAVLARDLAALGLAPVPQERITFLAADGRLITAPPPPARKR